MSFYRLSKKHREYILNWFVILSNPEGHTGINLAYICHFIEHSRTYRGCVCHFIGILSFYRFSPCFVILSLFAITSTNNAFVILANTTRDRSERHCTLPGFATACREGYEKTRGGASGWYAVGVYSVVYMDDWEGREDGHRNVYGIYSVFTVRKNIMKRAGKYLITVRNIVKGLLDRWLLNNIYTSKRLRRFLRHKSHCLFKNRLWIM